MRYNYMQNKLINSPGKDWRYVADFKQNHNCKKSHSIISDNHQPHHSKPLHNGPFPLYSCPFQAKSKLYLLVKKSFTENPQKTIN